MRELIERFSHRFQLWQKERYGDHWGADPTATRNPLRFVALVAVMSVILDATEPFVFHRGFDIVSIIRIPVALAFLVLYQSKSPYAWHVVVALLPLAFFAYWILRFAGYSHYQQRVHAPVSEFIAVLLHVVITVAVLFWLFRTRERYLRYIEDARLQPT